MALMVCLLLVAGSPPSAHAAFGIDSPNGEFNGTGTFKLTIQDPAVDSIKCGSAIVKGKVSQPINEKATFTEWTLSNCTVYNGNLKSVGPASVKVSKLPSPIEAVSATKLYFGSFTVKASFNLQFEGETKACNLEVIFSPHNPSYANGAFANTAESLLQAESYNSFFSPYPCPLAPSIFYSNAAFSWPDPQFEVKEPATPTVATNSASGVNQTGATLNGSITPNGLSTEYHFEYGTTETYGTKVPVPDASLTSNLYASQAVFKAVTGLLPGTTYHFRLVAKNSKGTVNGLDKTFTTVAPVCDALSASRIKIGDMNGDGKADIFRFTDPADKVGEAQVWRSEGKSFTPLGQVNTGFGVALEDRLADWDGDGDDDVFQFAGLGRVDGWRSNGTSYTQLSQVGSGFPHPCETRIGDISGDGKDDILRFNDEGNGYAWLSNGTPNNYTYKGLISTGFGHSNEVKVGDYNGDGYDDLFQFTNEGNGYLWRNNAGASFTYLGKFASGLGGPNEVRIGDMNGDGRDDLLRFSEEGNGYYWLSNGEGTFTYMGNFTSGFGPSRQVRIADINGDSKADILWFRIENGNGYAWLGDGKGGFESLGQIGIGFGAP